MIEFLKKLRLVFSRIFFDPLEMIYKWRGLPDYFGNQARYNRLHKGGPFAISWRNRMYFTYEKFLPAGIMRGHYFFQDIWAAEKVYASKVMHHVDVASRIDGFIAQLLPFCKVSYVDIRKMESPFPNLSFVEGSVTALPFEDNSVESLSCLHVIEHIGLGRYGDPVDPEGHMKAANELMRILVPGGRLYIGTPIGKERLCFDAHRIFYVETVCNMFNGLQLDEFSLIDDKGDSIRKNATYFEANQCNYGCGLFVFTKPK